MDSDDGADLRYMINRIKIVVLKRIKNLRIQTDQLIRQSKSLGTKTYTIPPRVSDEDVQRIERMFDKVVANNANDHQARTNQLLILFVALCVDPQIRLHLCESPPHRENDVARQLEAEKPVDQEKQMMVDQDRLTEVSNKIKTASLNMFMRHDVRGLLQQLLDRTFPHPVFVAKCVNAYISYTPAITPLMCRQVSLNH